MHKNDVLSLSTEVELGYNDHGYNVLTVCLLVWFEMDFSSSTIFWCNKEIFRKKLKSLHGYNVSGL